MNVSTLIELAKGWTLLSRLFPRRKPFPVLIVDDEPGDCVLFSDLLKSLPSAMKSESVSTPGEARVALRRGQFSLVLLDNKFPGNPMAGVEFFNEIKSERKGLKIVFITVDFAHLDLERIRDGHTVMAINKNMSNDALRAALQEALSLNGGFHASAQDIWFAAFILMAATALLTEYRMAIVNAIKLW